MRYLIIVEQAKGNMSACIPYFPTCVTTGATRDEVVARMREDIAFHLDVMRADGVPIPEPNSDPERVDVQ